MSDKTPFISIANHPRILTIMDGVRFAAGVSAYISVVLLITMGLSKLSLAPYDDSDSPPLRSGLTINTDALTGCQYFKTVFGGITPRMRADGRQVCAPQSGGAE